MRINGTAKYRLLTLTMYLLCRMQNVVNALWFVGREAERAGVHLPQHYREISFDKRDQMAS